MSSEVFDIIVEEEEKKKKELEQATVEAQKIMKKAEKEGENIYQLTKNKIVENAKTQSERILKEAEENGKAEYNKIIKETEGIIKQMIEKTKSNYNIVKDFIDEFLQRWKA
ncbi:MAG: hypothetical protein QXJ17_04190 [Nitrososphaeria archaeon]